MIRRVLRGTLICSSSSPCLSSAAASTPDRRSAPASPQLDGTAALAGPGGERSRRSRRARRPDDHRRPRAKTSPARWAFCTRRIVSSRWICSAASRLASWRGSSALARSKSMRTCACIASATSPHRALDRAEPSYRRVLAAYADGVNAGLNALGAPPFEYLVLRATPEPWHAEDSILTVLAMFNTLQGRQAAVRTIARRAARHAARADVSLPLDRRIRMGHTGSWEPDPTPANSRR